MLIWRLDPSASIPRLKRSSTRELTLTMIVLQLSVKVLYQSKGLLTSQVANPGVAALYEDALVYETGSAITSSGALSAYSGAKTGRSPSDKRIVKEPSSENHVWWGPVNKPMDPSVRLLSRITISVTDRSDVEDQPRTSSRLPQHSQQNLCRRWICRLG